MANFDEDIKRITEEVLQDGAVDGIIRKKVTEGFEKAIEDAFRWGELRKAIEKRVETILVPFIEQYDMAGYIVKLDQVLTEIVNQTSLTDNKKILEGFQFMMTEPQIEEMKVSEIFKEYGKFVARNMETYGREVNCEEGEPTYEPMNITMTFDGEDLKPWRLFEDAILELAVDEEEQEDKLNRTIRLYRWVEDKKPGWKIQTECNPTISSLRHLDKFDLFLVKLQRADVRILIDTERDDNFVYSDNEPEPTYE